MGLVRETLLLAGLMGLVVLTGAVRGESMIIASTPMIIYVYA